MNSPKKKRKVTTLRLPNELDVEVEAVADEIGLTKNAFMVTTLHKAVEQHKKARRGGVAR